MARSPENFDQGRIEVNKLNKRWIGLLTACMFVLALCAHPSLARLNEGNFIPFSQVVSSLADCQVQLYRIEKGDTLCQIAFKHEVSLNQLMATNNMNEDTILKIGDTLKIPVSQKKVHVIVSGDTMSNLAEQYHVSMQDLIEANQDKNPEYLQLGDFLYIPETAITRIAQTEPSRGGYLTSTMIWPIEGKITSSYGWRKSGFHHGLDIAAQLGTKIHAAEEGTVSFAGYKSIYGRTVIIDHLNGKQTLYAHAQGICVAKGDKVYRGQVIAAVGMTGNTTGPHVHFEVRQEGKVKNPLSYLPR